MTNLRIQRNTGWSRETLKWAQIKLTYLEQLKYLSKVLVGTKNV
jgi:hypothetical protein